MLNATTSAKTGLTDNKLSTRSRKPPWPGSRLPESLIPLARLNMLRVRSPRTEIMENLIPYIQEQTSQGVQLNHIMRHTVGLFHGQNGSRTWKQYLSKNMCIRDADLQKVNHIMDQVRKTNPVSLER